MDPITLAAISATVGGASGKLLEKAWDAGERWIIGNFGDHEQKALEQAKANTAEFLADLAYRLQRLEEEARDKQETKQEIEVALGDPDFSAILKEAIFISARTSNRDKHALLARTVAERLRADSESVLAMSSNMACRAIGNLTTKQLRLIALASIIYYMTPGVPFPPGDIPAHRFAEIYPLWLSQKVSAILPVESMTPIDVGHLAATGCTSDLPIRPSDRNLKDFLGPRPDTGYTWPYDEFIRSDVGKQLHTLWESGISVMPLTSVGRLIGIYVLDEATGVRTVIGWSD